jgi:aspartate carbamoyltransferase catalytic subunit
MLLERIPDEPAILERLRGRHVLAMSDFDAPLLRQLMRLAARYELGEVAGTSALRCKVMSSLYLDLPYCNGRLSFNTACMRLGGSLLDLDGTATDILRRRYAPEEIAELCNSYSDVALVRAVDTESLQDMLPHFRVPVINAGTGAGEHPSHAMADLYTLCKWRPGLFCGKAPAEDRLTIGLVGDPSRTRTLRSFLRMLTRFPEAVERVVLASRLEHGFATGQREELKEAGIRVETLSELYPLATDMEIARELVPATDLFYVHQVQTTHVRRMQIVESMALFKPDAMILSPDMQSEEASHLLNSSPANGYFAQARGSVFVRMALLTAILSC